MQTRINLWKLESKKYQTLNASACKLVIKQLLEYLLVLYRKQIETTTDISTGRLKLIFSLDQAIHCIPGSGIINFGLKSIKSKIDDGAYTMYPLEKEPLRSRCKNKEDILIWMVMHEFSHLFKDGSQHDENFFAKVLNMANENSFLFE